MQPSQLEIQREVEALRDIRRRSTAQGGPGALILDPDLPNPSSPTSPTSSYWAATVPQQLPDGDSSSGSHEDSSSSEDRSTGLDDPFHLFWVPARLHPEIDPGQFSAFLKEHSRTPPPDGAAGPVRSSSLSVPSTGLGRKRSMLSRQYKPSENDQVEDEDEKIVPSRPNRTPLTNTAPQLTISDLQRLEVLAEEASKSDDPTKLRNVIRRSLSLNVSPSAMDKMDNIPDMPDEADAPIIVPPPGLILRRAARTKIRKTTLPGDGGGHRFGSGRRPRAATQAEPRTSSELSSSDHVSSNDHGDATETGRRPRALSNESMTSDGHTSQTDVLIDETLILEAYLCDAPDAEASSNSSLKPNPPMLSFSLAHDEQPPTQIEPKVDVSTPELVLHHPQPQRLTLSPPPEESSRTPSPDTSTLAPSTEGIAASGAPQKVPSPVLKKEKDRKGLFKWASDKGGRKNGKDREREKEVQRVEKEGGFFGSLFSSKKKADEQASQPNQYGSGREAATALLGQSKSSKQYVPSPSPQLPGGQGTYARYPIHVERAIYRLSHIKLANPRRPLYEQVLISNLMFWYLGVINKTQNPAATPPVAQNQPAATTPVASISDNDQVERENERREAEERQRVENERLEREREIERERELQIQQQQQQQQLQQPQKKESPRRGALTKPPSGSQGARRVAEMPIKGPQYEMQHREMEQQYNGSSYGYSSPSPQPRMPRQSNPPVNAPQIVQPQSTSYMYPGYTGPGAVDQQQFPPVAMQSTESWASSSTSGAPPLPRTRLTPSPPPNHAPSTAASPQQAPARRSRSPPAQNHNRYSANVSPAATNRVQATRTTTRSLSATAIAGSSPPPLPTDGKARKATSAHAVMPTTPNRRPRAHAEPVPPRTERGEEEDVPLAVWQQQRRK
ncbi:uncharacterized protein EDB91DRAFT_868247 [Suillus paluster]|uniref:uncharacterized protein n=1 Tax=Suillus paluster TaxID=48578 RepID=UPI001B86ECF4|nr:uncharacterized protein EDB91DRAFT_868247 [Suillus paluster]KAG1728057.1 hypothetical protein EDB91DRAFT_868247 [Suillus paluster]